MSAHKTFFFNLAVESVVENIRERSYPFEWPVQSTATWWSGQTLCSPTGEVDQRHGGYKCSSFWAETQTMWHDATFSFQILWCQFDASGPMSISTMHVLLLTLPEGGDKKLHTARVTLWSRNMSVLRLPLAFTAPNQPLSTAIISHAWNLCKSPLGQRYWLTTLSMLDRDIPFRPCSGSINISSVTLSKLTHGPVIYCQKPRFAFRLNGASCGG